jgi:hypothetical protein
MVPPDRDEQSISLGPKPASFTPRRCPFGLVFASTKKDSLCSAAIPGVMAEELSQRGVMRACLRKFEGRQLMFLSREVRVCNLQFLYYLYYRYNDIYCKQNIIIIVNLYRK